LGRSESNQGFFANAFLYFLQCRNDVEQETAGIVIPFIQRNPGDMPLTASNPPAQQGGFAESGWSGDEGHFAV